MDAADQAAEQIVRMTLAGSETAIRLTGAASKNVAAALMAAATGKEKTKGKARLASMLKSGKELKVFQLKQIDLERFAVEAKRYGVLYTVVKPESKDAPTLDVMVKAEDASKINRILEKMGYGRVEEQPTTAVADRIDEPQRAKEPDGPETTSPDHQQANVDALAEMLSTPKGKEDGEPADPFARAEAPGPRSEPTSASSTRSEGGAAEKTPDGRDRRSVRGDIEELRRQRRAALMAGRADKTREEKAAPSERPKSRRER